MKSKKHALSKAEGSKIKRTAEKRGEKINNLLNWTQINTGQHGLRGFLFTTKSPSYTSTLDVPCSMLVLSGVEGSDIQIILTLIPCCPDPHPLLSWLPVRLSTLLRDLQVFVQGIWLILYLCGAKLRILELCVR